MLVSMVKRSSNLKTRHAEGPLLFAMIARTTPRPIDIARAAGFSRQYVHAVLTGRRPASTRFIRACRKLGLPVDVIWRKE